MISIRCLLSGALLFVQNGVSNRGWYKGIADLRPQRERNSLSERFMAPFARQGQRNEVIGIDAEGLVQRLLLFDHCIIPTIWFKDVQLLLRIVDPESLCELIDSGAVSFYIDSATGAETGQARSQLGLTGNTTRLRDNEFSFSTVRGHDEPRRVRNAINELASTDCVSRIQARSVAERIEAAMLEPRGLAIHSESFTNFYQDLRKQDSSLVRDLVAHRLRALGANPKNLQVKVEEFVPEDFRVISNLTSTFGLSDSKARQITSRALMDLSSIHIRLAHMREFSCLIGMSEEERTPWDLKVDSLISRLVSDNERIRQFTRVAPIAGIGETQLLRNGTIDLRRLLDLRQSDDLAVFKAWLKDSDNKSDEEILDRVSSVRSKIGNAAQSKPGKLVRLLLSCLTGFIEDPLMSQVTGLGLGVADSFLLEKAFPKDAVLGILGVEYPSLFRNEGGERQYSVTPKQG